MITKGIQVHRTFIETMLHFENASGKDETRTQLMSIHLMGSDKKDSFIVEACDGVVLVRRTLYNKELNKELNLWGKAGNDIILSTIDFKKVKMYLGEWKNHNIFYMWIAEGCITFSINDKALTYESVYVRRVHRDYPKTSTIVPKGNITKEFIVNMNELIKIYKSFQKVADVDRGIMKFRLRSDLKPIEIVVPGNKDLLGVIMPVKE